MIKKNLIAVVILAMLVLVGCGSPTAAPTSEAQPPSATEELKTEEAVKTEAPDQPEKKYVIGMMTIVTHPSLDAIQQGVKDALAEAGFEEGKNVEYIMGNAEGDIATLSTIAQQFIDEKVDLIVAVS